MKIIYSLQEFRNELLEIAKLANENYTSLAIEVNHTGIVNFRAYIHNKGWHDGKTVDECLDKLRKVLTGEPPTNIEVEFDIEPLTIEVPEQITPQDDIPF